MSVYREGYNIIKEVETASKQIFPDACDFGAPTRKGDRIWNSLGQLIKMYGDKNNNRKVDKYETGKTATIEVTLIDEWAVSDERKTIAQAHDKFRVTYTSCNTGLCKGMDGYVYIEKL